jgi:hypothetical protein
MRFFERPDTPAQAYAGAAGLFLLLLGVLSLIFAGVEFGTVGALEAQPDFVIWALSGWTVVFWIAIGTIGLLAMASLGSATAFSVIAGVVFSVLAVWGFLDGNDIGGLLVADAASKFMYTALGVLGLVAGSIPRASQRAPGDARRDRDFERAVSGRESAGRW